MSDEGDLGAVAAKGRTRGIVARHAGILVALVAAWEISCRMGWLDPLFFPYPSAILLGFWRLYITQGNIWPHLGLTMLEVLVGFLAGSALGIALAVCVGMSDRLRRYLKPYVVVLEATPRIAIGPVIIAAFGFGWTSKTAIVMLVCFFAPFVNTLNGIVGVEPEKQSMFRSMGASKVQTFTKLLWPSALPEISAGLRLAMASALGGALVAEFIASNAGLGVLITQYTGTLNMASAFVCVLTLSALGYFIFRGMEELDRIVVFWSDGDRTDAMSRRRKAAWRAKMGTTS
ncbi:ABC transporter permease [Palleronia pelagia]|uniref:NitT/TauT family transport system permease protein n=1 Tax=Palleronia pelagia TaxID=387096 RepID=A0A1H8AHC3_9RHOB|nr:ABC transporter permease [Palleronia pelagia]SEM69896.1 NitT/TauT family transport system permease protein [Palleronia pelagia]